MSCRTSGRLVTMPVPRGKLIYYIRPGVFIEGHNLQVPPHYVLQHGTLSTGLTTNDHYLREIDRVLYANSSEDILEFVHQSRKFVSAMARRGQLGETNVIRPGSEMPPCPCAAMILSVLDLGLD